MVHCSYFCQILNKAEIIKGNAVQQCKDEVNIQVRECTFKGYFSAIEIIQLIERAILLKNWNWLMS